jgi:UDP-GlcNAc3NAcA epimerase
MIKIVTVIGARPQFIKAAALSRQINLSSEIQEIIIHTGQHFDANMSDVFFEEMNIPKPNYNLNINSNSHGAMTGQMLEKIESILLDEKPDFVLVYGDTNSTIAGALAAKKLHIKVIHVEAGLRSFNMQMPEEINRILTDRISDILFCPTDTAIQNLKNEGYDNIDCDIQLSGDIMQDTALYYKGISDNKSSIIKNLGLESGKFLLATLHRAENTDNSENLMQIIDAFNILSKEIKVVLPLHPRSTKKLKELNIKLEFDIIEPVGYFDVLQLISNSRIVLTDSGGLQKEAYFFNKFCVTLREQTEWTELVDNGYNFLVGSSTQRILEQFSDLRERVFVKKEELYGGGNTAINICNHLVKHYAN